jgi:hypothetical protein
MPPRVKNLLLQHTAPKLNPFEVQWQLYVPSALMLNNFVSCPQRINNNYFLKQHYPTDICNGVALCFRWGRNWIFKCYLHKLSAAKRWLGFFVFERCNTYEQHIWDSVSYIGQSPWPSALRTQMQCATKRHNAFWTFAHSRSCDFLQGYGSVVIIRLRTWSQTEYVAREIRNIHKILFESTMQLFMNTHR